MNFPTRETAFCAMRILFATGSTLLFEFKDVAVSRVRRSQPFTSR